MAPVNSKRVRVICYAWGDKYVDDFLYATLPALLAAGNLPHLAGRFDLEFVFLTEAHQWARIRATPSWQRLDSLCKTKLVALDDLIVGHWYGISLSKILVRSFAELGAAMLETYLIFLNADFIIANGSYRSLADKIEAGETLIFAPSYCVLREDALPELMRYRRGDILDIAPREMAAIGLANRHYTIRAKTANQRLFRIHRYDQFYWYVDRQTLLARQMPIALVCMRPQKVQTDIHTFWDYGVVSEFCPTARPCVLGDSDDYLMIELRDERTFAELMGLGWPSLDEIGKDLSSFTTKDQRDHLQHELIWHAGGLPSNLNAARREFSSFIGEVERRLSPEPVSYERHAFWEAAIGRYEQMRAEFLATGERQDVEKDVGTESVAQPPTVVAVPVSGNGLRSLSQRFFGSVPFVRKPHPYWADLRHAMHAIREKMPLETARVLIVGPGAGLFERLMTKAKSAAKVTLSYLLARRTTIVALDGDLLLQVEDENGAVQQLEARRVTVVCRRDQEKEEGLVGAWSSRGPFDLCVCELGFDEMAHFGDLFGLITPHMREGGRIVILLIDGALGRRIDAARIIRSGLPLDGRSEILYSGTRGSSLARHLMKSGVAFGDKHGPTGKLVFGAAALVAAALSSASARAV
jgi:hypothetical protein